MEKDLCIRCMRCSKICPDNAIGSRDYPEGITDKRTCATRSSELHKRYISPCGLCIRVCPVGEDRIQFRRKDMNIYNEKADGFRNYHAAWNHVRSYGGK